MNNSKIKKEIIDRISNTKCTSILNTILKIMNYHDEDINKFNKCIYHDQEEEQGELFNDTER